MVHFINAPIYNPVFDSDIWKNTAERLILHSFSGGAFSFYDTLSYRTYVYFMPHIWYHIRADYLS